MTFEIFLIIAFFIALTAGLLLNRFFLNRPINFLVKKANNSAIRWSSQSKPIFGGITFYSIFTVGFIAYILIIDQDIISNPKTIALFLAVTISFIMGLADDIINTPPSFKFIVQLLCAIIFIAFDIYIVISPYNILNYTITILWVIGIMNSINMLDNMDSITNLISLSIISGAIFPMLFLDNQSHFIIYILVFITAGMISFLFYNWNPSKMYMGDNGSQFLGSILAFVGIVYFWNAIPLQEMSFGYNSKQFIIVLLAFIVPISDTTTVTINRLLRGQSPFVGGRDHTTHHLSYAGLSDRGVAILLFSINSICVAISIYIIHNTDNWNSTLFWSLLSFAFIIFVGLFSLTKITKAK